MLSIKNLRENYGKGELIENDAPPHPYQLFDAWFRLALDNKIAEPNAMVLSTVSQHGTPRSRVVLLKEYSQEGFIFFTNYSSAKGRDIENNPNVSLNFLWLAMERQIRIEGKIEKISEAESEEYFNSRPLGSKLGALASNQSAPIESRNELEQKLNKLSELTEVKRPINWGGYCVRPILIEFWQGRANRLHDRIEYNLVDGNWAYQRLQP